MADFWTFGQAPEIAFALPFVNLSFEHWEDTLPDGWTLDPSPVGTRTPYRPGYDLTPGALIADTGVITTGYYNGLYQTIDLPDYIENNQKCRFQFATKTDLGGSYGASYTILRLKQNSGAYEVIGRYGANDANWVLVQRDSDFTSPTPILTAYSDIGLIAHVRSYDGSSDPAGVIDSIAVEYGRTIGSWSDVFTHFPEFHPNLIKSFMPGRKAERGGRGKRRSFDKMGGAVKWRVTMPFRNVPASFVEMLEEYWIRNKGLAGYPGIPLVLHHHLTDPAASHTAGHEYLRTPGYIICDIVEDEWPFSPSGAYLGAGMYSGTLTFEEI